MNDIPAGPFVGRIIRPAGVSGGRKPYGVNPAMLSNPESEGAAASYDINSDISIPVVHLGSTSPTDGDMAVCIPAGDRVVTLGRTVTTITVKGRVRIQWPWNVQGSYVNLIYAPTTATAPKSNPAGGSGAEPNPPAPWTRLVKITRTPLLDAENPADWYSFTVTVPNPGTFQFRFHSPCHAPHARTVTLFQGDTYDFGDVYLTGDTTWDNCGTLYTQIESNRHLSISPPVYEKIHLSYELGSIDLTSTGISYGGSQELTIGSDLWLFQFTLSSQNIVNFSGTKINEVYIKGVAGRRVYDDYIFSFGSMVHGGTPYWHYKMYGWTGTNNDWVPDCTFGIVSNLWTVDWMSRPLDVTLAATWVANRPNNSAGQPNGQVGIIPLATNPGPIVLAGDWLGWPEQIQ